MRSSRTIIYLVLIMATIATAIGGITTGVHYEAAFEDKRQSLIGIAKPFSEDELIKCVDEIL